MIRRRRLGSENAKIDFLPNGCLKDGTVPNKFDIGSTVHTKCIKTAIVYKD